MNISQKALAVGARAFAIGMTSCKDDGGESSSVSKQDAKNLLNSFNTSTKTDLQEFSESNGIEAIQQFFDLTSVSDPFERVGTDKKGVRKLLQEKGRKFKSVFTPSTSKGRSAEDEHFDFNAHKGVYEWNSTEEVFVKTGASEIIKIKYPTVGSASNNAELRLTSYSDVMVYDEEEESYYYVPTGLEASILIGEQTVSSIDLSADWDDYGFPLEADITLASSPYTANLSFDVSGSTSNTLAFSVLNGNETLVAASVTVKYEDSSKSEDAVKSIQGFVQLTTLKVKGEINAAAANNEEVDMNDIFDLSLYNGAEKLGKIVFVDENEEAVPYLRYADGTKERLEDVLQPVIDELEELSDSIEDNS